MAPHPIDLRIAQIIAPVRSTFQDLVKAAILGYDEDLRALLKALPESPVREFMLPL